MLISRRSLLKGFLALSATGATFSGYAMAEPFRLRVARYTVTPKGWPRGLKLRLALLSDLHVIEPWMGVRRIAQIVARTNALEPDAVMLLGDYVPSSGMRNWAKRVGTGLVEADDWACELARLKAPLGIHAVLGNHDMWEDVEVQRRHGGDTPAGLALQRAGIALHENAALRVSKDGEAFWICGLADQWAFYMLNGAKPTSGHYLGADDLEGTLRQVTDDRPVVLMAHEPDVFARMGPHGNRVALTVSGHTHGGQIAFLGYRPVIPSDYGARFAYGHIVEDGRHLVVSGGLGCSGLPVRFGVPPEIVIVEVGGEIA